MTRHIFAVRPKRLLRPLLGASLALGLSAGLAVGLATPASARPENAGQVADTRFAAMDTDKDGMLSREEFFAALPQMKEGAFAAIDTDRNDSISPEEWQRFFSGHGKNDPHATDGMPSGMGGMPSGMGGMAPDNVTPPAASSAGTTPGGTAPAGKAPELILPPAKAE